MSAQGTGDASWEPVLHPDELSRTHETWKRSIRTGEAYEMEYRLKRASDGAFRWHLSRACPIKDADGGIVRWFGTCTDIDDYKHLEAERETLLLSERTARAEAERVSRLKDEFLATLSHELRTPLNAIYGWAQVLRGGAANPEDLEQGLATIERNARAQKQIIDDLLDMSAIISGKLRMDVQRLYLALGGRGGHRNDAPGGQREGHPLAGGARSAGPARSAGDPNRLQQIFWNLLTNAIKFTPRDGRVQVLLESTGSHLEVSVIDSGEGISAEFLPHVFERFRQQDASMSRRHGGLGLGLSIVRTPGGTPRRDGASKEAGVPIREQISWSPCRSWPSSRTRQTSRTASLRGSTSGGWLPCPPPSLEAGFDLNRLEGAGGGR